jgi:hypothetical protein
MASAGHACKSQGLHVQVTKLGRFDAAARCDFISETRQLLVILAIPCQAWGPSHVYQAWARLKIWPMLFHSHIVQFLVDFFVPFIYHSDAV